MKTFRFWASPLIALGLLAGLAGTSSGSLPLQHERLRIRNDFKTPEEVVSYYCARDASGFVWSGLLDSERRAFTLWEEAPQQDTFYVARKYDINPDRVNNVHGDQADVEVRYEIAAVGDANGTVVPVAPPEKRVVFNLKRVNGLWKIARPAPGEIAPVVLESKFPVASR